MALDVVIIDLYCDPTAGFHPGAALCEVCMAVLFCYSGFLPPPNDTRATGNFQPSAAVSLYVV